jgi:hypothetical protein
MTKKPSSLDANQVLQHAFDEEDLALRVKTDATIIEGNLEVAVDHVTDSIKIGDGTRTAGVTHQGAVKVSSGLVKEAFDYFSGEHTNTTSVYTYRRGGPSGTVVATVSIVYTNTNKSEIASLTVT